jgi:UDP-N-acetylmuramoyl-L-alanyl-D-glutamate--2,6-diaminopimelate ligase
MMAASESRHTGLLHLMSGIGESGGLPDIAVSGLATDSRSVVSGDVFFAVSGFREHGLRYGSEAVEQGAAAIVYDPEGTDSDQVEQLRQSVDCPLVSVSSLRSELGPIADRFYGCPSAGMDLVGITGTNGKTSCCNFLGQALSRFKPTGVVGTTGWGFPGSLRNLSNTTPEPVQMHAVLASLRQQGAKFVAMEVSSHGLVQKRTRAVRFVGAAFTNITRDHLDFHKTMRVYVNAKLELLSSPGLQFVVINMDDRHADRILKAVPSGVRIMGFSRSQQSDSPFVRLKLSALRHDGDGVEFKVHFEGRTVPVSTPLFCDFNVENLLTVLGIMLELGVSLDEAVAALVEIRPVAGRLEHFSQGDDAPLVIVDYAHTPHALQSILQGVRRHCQGELWLVFGCGGDRDRGKRPLMGRIAEKFADQVVLTDDNPRLEDGSWIIKEILRGFADPDVRIERDRRKAIQLAIQHALPNDLVVIAGKGHETMQEINDVRFPCDDRALAREALVQRVAAGNTLQ